MKLTLIFAGFLVVTLLSAARAQEWPKAIRGYKLHDPKITVANISAKAVKDDKTDVYVRFIDPKIVDFGLSGLSFETLTEITSGKQGGHVDFVTFHDFRVNGLAVEIEEFDQAFAFKKGEPVLLPKPARASISLTKIPLAAYKNLSETGADLAITGTAFVFGKFKKFGFSFKRVIPIKINLRISNPLNQK